jgi:hypothetical protein
LDVSLDSGNVWLDAMAQRLAHVGIDARNLLQIDPVSPSDASDLASVVLSADQRLAVLHRQTRQARDPDVNQKLANTLQEVFVLAKNLVAEVGLHSIKILTELKTLQEQLAKVETKVDLFGASSRPQQQQQQQPQPLHPALLRHLSELSNHQVQSNQSLSRQVAQLASQHHLSNEAMKQRLDQVDQKLENKEGPDKLDECIKETIGKPVFLQWMEWIGNLWQGTVPKNSQLWHPQVRETF